MRMIGHDVTPTCNTVVNEFKQLEIKAMMVPDIEERMSFYKFAIDNTTGFKKMIDSEVLVLARRVIKREDTDSEKAKADANIMFSGKVATWNYVISEEAGCNGLVIDYSEPEVIVNDEADFIDYSELTFQVPVLDIMYCSPPND